MMKALSKNNDELFPEEASLFSGRAKWIAESGSCPGIVQHPAALFRKCFSLKEIPENAIVRIAVSGYYELYLNGEKVGPNVITPGPSDIRKLIFVTELDLSGKLRKGKNELIVMVGKGFSSALPAVKLSAGDFLFTDSSWESGNSPVVSSHIYQGECYDARLEEEADWKPAVLTQPPGGQEILALGTPCQIIRKITPRSMRIVNGEQIFDFGENISGWLEIAVKGKRGGSVTITSGELLNADGSVDTQSCYHGKDPFQVDRYILKGGEQEVWSPKFRYNGFRYAAIGTDSAELLDVQACFIRSAFRKTGDFSCSIPEIDRLFKCFCASYESNFCGIPTDCPHREKRGWTADAHLVMESGLMLYDSSSNYHDWLRQFPWTQRPSGNIPGVIPGAVSDLIYECGPAWDAAAVFAPWYLYCHTGDLEPARELYDTMRLLLDHTMSRSEDSLPEFGLGDWLHPGRRNKHPWLDPDTDSTAPKQLVCSAYFYRSLMLFVRFAELLDHPEDVRKYSAMASQVRDSYRKKFYRGNGIFANGVPTAQALSIDFGLAEPEEITPAVRKMAEDIRENGCRIAFGMAGIKSGFRVLAKYGYIDTVTDMLTQPDYPGYANWLNMGAVTLFEQWDGSESRNHPVFGCFADVLIQYAAGIRPDENIPGMKHLIFDPRIPEKMDHASATVNTPCGPLSASWRKEGGSVRFSLDIPEGCSVRYRETVLTKNTKGVL